MKVKVSVRVEVRVLQELAHHVECLRREHNKYAPEVCLIHPVGVIALTFNCIQLNVACLIHPVRVQVRFRVRTRVRIRVRVRVRIEVRASVRVTARLRDRVRAKVRVRVSVSC